MTARIEQRKHGGDRAFVIPDVFEHADAGDEVKLLRQRGARDVVILHMEVAIEHAFGPIVLHIIAGRDDEAAGVHQVRQRSIAGSNVQDAGGTNARQLFKDKTKLYRPFIAADKLLMLIFRSAKLFGVPFPKPVHRLLDKSQCLTFLLPALLNCPKPLLPSTCYARHRKH